MTVQFALSTEIMQVRDQVRQFVDDVVIPVERTLTPHGQGLTDEQRRHLQEQAKAAGVFAPTAPHEFGGLQLNHRDQAVVLEEAGRSTLGPAALHCAAPDEGNILLLDRKCTAEQRRRYLAPLATGQVRSAFAMTEPSPGAGSDPEQLLTWAERVPTGWRITGTKWLITGAAGAAFFIVMARTSTNAATMFLVDAANPGLRLVRHISTIDSSFAGGHCELEFYQCEVGPDDVLGAVGRGFADAQVRLGPARLTHCMRWLGAARRAQEVAVSYSAHRPMFGSRLADQGMAQQMIAQNEIDIAASRALIWQAAWTLDTGRPGRMETSIAKVFVAEAVNRIVDRSMQLCGGFGLSYDSPLPHLLREVRPFRIYDGPTEVHLRAISRRVVRGVDSAK